MATTTNSKKVSFFSFSRKEKKTVNISSHDTSDLANSEAAKTIKNYKYEFRPGSSDRAFRISDDLEELIEDNDNEMIENMDRKTEGSDSRNESTENDNTDLKEIMNVEILFKKHAAILEQEEEVVVISKSEEEEIVADKSRKSSKERRNTYLSIFNRSENQKDFLQFSSDEVKKEGSFYKLGSVVKNWKLRQYKIILRDTEDGKIPMLLYIDDSRGGNKVKGVLYLEHAHISIQETSYSKQFIHSNIDYILGLCIHLTTENTQSDLTTSTILECIFINEETTQEFISAVFAVSSTNNSLCFYKDRYSANKTKIDYKHVKSSKIFTRSGGTVEIDQLRIDATDNIVAKGTFHKLNQSQYGWKVRKYIIFKREGLDGVAATQSSSSTRSESATREEGDKPLLPGNYLIYIDGEKKEIKGGLSLAEVDLSFDTSWQSEEMLRRDKELDAFALMLKTRRDISKPMVLHDATTVHCVQLIFNNKRDVIMFIEAIQAVATSHNAEAFLGRLALAKDSLLITSGTLLKLAGTISKRWRPRSYQVLHNGTLVLQSESLLKTPITYDIRLDQAEVALGLVSIAKAPIVVDTFENSSFSHNQKYELALKIDFLEPSGKTETIHIMLLPARLYEQDDVTEAQLDFAVTVETFKFLEKIRDCCTLSKQHVENFLQMIEETPSLLAIHAVTSVEVAKSIKDYKTKDSTFISLLYFFMSTVWVGWLFLISFRPSTFGLVYFLTATAFLIIIFRLMKESHSMHDVLLSLQLDKLLSLFTKRQL